MSDIPAARKKLLEIAADLPPSKARQIHAVVEGYLHREKFVRRAPDNSKPITPVMKRQIFAWAKTDMHMSEIAHRLGINQGRVSEVLRGKR